MRFLIAFFVGLLPAMGLAIAGRQFLSNTYETVSYEDIIREQRTRGGIYSSALRDDFYDYKVALYQASRPKVIAVGSSRAWGQESRWFRTPFLTVGGGVRSVQYVERIYEDLSAIGPLPSHVILFADYWWFNRDYRPSGAPIPGTSRFDELKLDIEDTLGLWLRPVRWVIDRRVALRDWFRLAIRPQALPAPLPPTYGIEARYNLHGFAADGHYLYLGDAIGLRRFRGFDDELKLIETGEGRFVFGEHAELALLERFRTVVKRLEERGTRVSVVLAPVAAPALKSIERMGTKLGYIQEVRDWMRTSGLRVYDFTDSHVVGGSDCEFIDAYHPGEVLNARITLALARDPNSGLGSIVDVDALSTAIARDSGRVLVDGARFGPHREVDFRDLGCPK